MSTTVEKERVALPTTAAGNAVFFLICSAIVWTTLFYGTVHQPIISLFYLVIGAIGVLWAVDAFRSGYFRFDNNLIQIPLAAAAVYGVIQLIPFGTRQLTGGLEGIPRTISYDPFSTQVVVMHFAALLIFLSASLVFIDTGKRLRTVIRLIAVFGFLYAFYAILQMVLSPNKIYGIYGSEFAVPFGSFVNRHNFAAYMEMTLAVTLGILFSGGIRKDARLLYITAAALMGLALLLSGSRGGLVSAIAGIAFLSFLTFGKYGKRQLMVRIGTVVLIVATVVAGAFMIGGESSLTRVADTAASDNISTNRTQIWSASLEIVKNNLPFGVGMGAFGYAYSQHDRFNGLERVEQAHNDYIEVLADAGIPGAIIGIFFLYFLFRSGLKAVRLKDRFLRGSAAGALAGCFSILVHSLFDFVLHTTAVAILFLTLAAIVGVCLRLGRATPGKSANENTAANVTPISQNASA